MTRSTLEARLRNLELTTDPHAADALHLQIEEAAERVRVLLAPYPLLALDELPPDVRQQTAALMRQIVAVARQRDDARAPPTEAALAALADRMEAESATFSAARIAAGLPALT